MRICIFCGSSLGGSEEVIELTRSLGELIGARGYSLVYGGGSVGLMGVVSKSALQAGANVTGIIPEALLNVERGSQDVTELIVVRSMHERKAKMVQLSSAFLTLPGGFGTFDELCEMITWRQLGIHHKPIVLLNWLGYFDPFLAQIEHAIATGFVKPELRDLIHVAATSEAALDFLTKPQQQQKTPFSWNLPELETP